MSDKSCSFTFKFYVHKAVARSILVHLHGIYIHLHGMDFDIKRVFLLDLLFFGSLFLVSDGGVYVYAALGEQEAVVCVSFCIYRRLCIRAGVRVIDGVDFDVHVDVGGSHADKGNGYDSGERHLQCHVLVHGGNGRNGFVL